MQRIQIIFNLFKRPKILTFWDLRFQEEEFSKAAKIALLNTKNSPEIVKCLESSLNQYSARVEFSNGYFISVKFGTMFYSNGKDTYEVYSNLDRDVFCHLTSEEVTEYMIKIQNQ